MQSIHWSAREHTLGRVFTMQGIIFTKFAELVERTWGMETWNNVLASADLESEGAYTVAMQYSDDEMFALIGQLSNITHIPVNTLVENFGEFLFEHLFDYCPLEFSTDSNVLDFLETLNDVVHAEVMRVHPEAYVPKFDIERISENEMQLTYHSKRALCILCKGLIQGAAKHFKQNLSIGHPSCWLRGDKSCTFHLLLVNDPA